MAKSNVFINFLAISLIFMLIVSTEVEKAEAQSCGWAYRGLCFFSLTSCGTRCTLLYGARAGRCGWLRGRFGCLCHYGSCPSTP
ncbi:unnamed protein product [Amaranthus hypochondriacus]